MGEVAERPSIKIWDLTSRNEAEDLAQLLGETPELWDDRARQNPVLTFLQLYAAPTSLVFEIGERAGMLAIIEVVPGFRAKAVVASWKPEAMRVPDVWKVGLKAAMKTKDLLLIEALIAEDNELSRKAAESVGFEYRGNLRRPSYYNGEPKELRWYVLPREKLLED